VRAAFACCAASCFKLTLVTEAGCTREAVTGCGGAACGAAGAVVLVVLAGVPPTVREGAAGVATLRGLRTCALAPGRPTVGSSAAHASAVRSEKRTSLRAARGAREGA
jgi:hypothetical protein